MVAVVPDGLEGCVADERDQPEHPEQRREDAEDDVRLVHDVGPHDGAGRLQHVLVGAREQPRLAGLGVGADRDALDGQLLVAGLDDRLHAVAEPRDRVQQHERLAGVGAEAARRVRQVGPGRLVDDPAAHPLQQDLRAREVLDQVDLAVGDDDVGAPGQDGLDQVGDPVLGVLVVAVGVDHDVGAELERALHPVVEGAPEPAVAGVPHEVRDAVLLGHLDGAVRGAVVDDQYEDLVDAGDRRGDAGQDGRERLLLVEAGDLDDEAHGIAPRPSWPRRWSTDRARRPCARSRPARRSAGSPRPSSG